jgi:hypothetical protein
MAKGTPALWVRFRAKKAKSKKELGSAKVQKSEALSAKKCAYSRFSLSLPHH